MKYHTYSISIFYLFYISKLIGSNPDAFFLSVFSYFLFSYSLHNLFFMAFKRQLNILPYNHRISILSFSKKFEDRPTDGPTERPTDRPKYRQTDVRRTKSLIKTSGVSWSLLELLNAAKNVGLKKFRSQKKCR